MTDGSVYQRHRVSCPRAADGTYLPHKCRGRWAYTIDLGRQGDGKRRQLQKSGFPNRTAAKEAMAEATRLLGQGDIVNVNLTVDAYLQEWLTNKRGLRHSTSVAYESHVRLYLKPRLGALRLRELRPHHLDRMYLEIANGTRGRPLSAATLRRIHATLNSALQAAVKRRLIPYNPAAHVELPTPLRPGTTVWTPQQLNAFFASVSDHRLLPLYRLIAIAGLRRGEALGLRWIDVDLDKGLLVVRRQVTDVRGKLTIGPPKTKAGVRAVPLDAQTVDSLAMHKDRQQQEHAAWAVDWSEESAVFTYEDGRLLRPEYVTRRFQALAKRAKLPVIRLHDLRHTSASLALAAGVPMKVVSDRLGHSSTAITADLYTHVSPAVARDAADAIAALLSSSFEPVSGAPVSNLLANATNNAVEGDHDDA